MRSSLVIQTSFIGDIILTTPLINELSQRGPVDVVTTKVGASILKHDPRIRHLHVYEKRGKDSGISGLLRFSHVIRESVSGKDEIRTAYLAQGSMRSAALAMLAGCKERIGFDTSGGRLLYTKVVRYDRVQHHAKRLFSLGMTEGTALPQLSPSLFPSPEDIAAVDELLHGSTRPLIALAPGSVWATKRWPYYTALAGLIDGAKFDIALIGGPEDSEIGGAIESAVNIRVINAIGKLSLLGSAELIRRSAIIITNDSSPQHLASAVGTPTVTVFGPTVPEFGFGPLAAGSAVTGVKDLACRPCDKHGPKVCPLTHWKCMRELPPAAVLETAMGVEGKNSRPRD